MGDGAEGLVDAQARIQDRLDELEQARAQSRRAVKNPDLEQRLQSLRLARADLARQAGNGANPTMPVMRARSFLSRPGSGGRVLKLSSASILSCAFPTSVDVTFAPSR
jgi:hypothetical protein